MRPSSRVDLHIHSTASDGELTPSEVVRLALERGLEVIALTDHDTMSGVDEAQAAAAGTTLEVIPGVEVNSEGEWGDLHILGFYVDPDHPPLNEQLRAVREARARRARMIVEKLRGLGLDVDWEEVQALASGPSIGRPHIAQALLERGYVASLGEAFERYIGRDGPAYVSRLRMTPPEVIRAIREAGGVAVLAHPAHSNVTARIEEFVGYGLQGLEVYYPTHSPHDVATLLALCRRFDLLATGGSDFHGPGYDEGVLLGAVHVPPQCAEELRRVRQRMGNE